MASSCTPTNGDIRPSTPSNVTATTTEVGAILVQWDKPASGYPSPTYSVTRDGTVIISNLTHPWYVDTVVAGEYLYTILATNSSGSEESSSATGISLVVPEYGLSCTPDVDCDDCITFNAYETTNPETGVKTFSPFFVEDTSLYVSYVEGSCGLINIAPGDPLNVVVSDDQHGVVLLQWDKPVEGSPYVHYTVKRDGVTIVENLEVPWYQDIVAEGTYDYQIISTNYAGFGESSIVSGTALEALARDGLNCDPTAGCPPCVRLNSFVSESIDGIRTYETFGTFDSLDSFVNSSDNSCTATTEAPTVPGNFTASDSNRGSVLLQWDNPVTATPPATYTIIRDGNTVIENLENPWFLDLVTEGTYDYKIIATNSAGSSETALVDGSALPPPPSTGLTCTVGSNCPDCVTFNSIKGVFHSIDLFNFEISFAILFIHFLYIVDDGASLSIEA